MSGTAFYRCLADPINAPAAAYADEFLGRSIALKLNMSQAIPINDLGIGAIKFAPTLPTNFCKTFKPANTTTQPLVQVQSLSSDDYTNLTANFNLWRPVSSGARVSYTGSSDAGKGEVLMIGTQYTDPGLDVATWRDAQGLGTVAVRDMKGPLVGAFHAFDRCPFASMTGDFSAAFPFVWIGVQGAPANDTGFRVDYTINLELVPNLTSVHHQLATTTPYNTDANMTVARRLTPVNVIPQNGESVLSLLSKAERKRAAPKKKATRKKPYAKKASYKRSTYVNRYPSSTARTTWTRRS